MKKFRRLISFILCAVICAVFAIAQTQPTPQGKAATTASASSPKTASTAGPTDAEIANAKAKSMVWVNTGSGVYHKSGRWYGKTKDGKFMSEADARNAGYRPAK